MMMRRQATAPLRWYPGERLIGPLPLVAQNIAEQPWYRRGPGNNVAATIIDRASGKGRDLSISLPNEQRSH